MKGRKMKGRKMKGRNRLVALVLAVCLFVSSFGGMIPKVSAEEVQAITPARGTKIYSNDFEGETLLANWTTAGTIVEKGEGHVLRSKPGTGSALSIWNQALEVQDFVASATVCISPENDSFNPGKNGASAGLVFRRSDDSHFYHFRMDASSTNGVSLQLYKWNGSATKLTTCSFDWKMAESYTLAVWVKGGTILCYLDGELVLSYTDSAPLT